ncbi:unnamed protein product [Adineta ricciae]|uniref:Uncharacterized protein n=1 Tax=Adineta ricciae TaxID=249248 RepID=A0A814ASE6_ADIRI|nr:unnamed protein product [Adineta ricciae]CAF1236185.1 unnamed protein product [Adineta ricciae]
MKLSYSLFIFASCVLVLVFQIACLDAAALPNEKSAMVESSASDENDASVRNKKEANGIAPQQTIPVPLRRHHLKFGVLGKRYAYGYLGKRTEVPEFEEDFEDWLNNLRERRAGRPQYGLLG